MRIDLHGCWVRIIPCWLLLLIFTLPTVAMSQQLQADIPDISAEPDRNESDGFGETTLVFAPVPDWVTRETIPEAQTAATRGMAGSLALMSHQHKITDDGGIYYKREVVRLSEASALRDIGTYTLLWTPGREKMTLHHLEIVRGNERINVLENGQEFEYLRREANLSEGILDGQITASLIIQDLRVGDMIDLAFSLETTYSPLIGHYQNIDNYIGVVKIDRLTHRVIWPEHREVFINHGKNLPPYKARRENGFEIREFTVDGIDEKAMPSNLPERFYYDRVSQISTFRSWQEVASRFRPLFEEASIVPKEGPLRDAVEDIRSAMLNRKELAQHILAMVQNEVRYVGDFSGLGNYTPESAASVWASKYGDCKGKTALLTALLREFGFEATPVLVHSKGIEPIERVIPAPMAFNHVIVRLELDGETYWLDGTRRQDKSLEQLPPIFFGYMLPLDDVAEPVYIHDKSYNRPQSLYRAIVDASEGLDQPARYRVEDIRYDDAAKAYINKYGNMTESEKQEAIEKFAESDDGRYATLDNLEFFSAPGKLSAKLVYEGTTLASWINGKGFQKYLAKDLTVGRNFHFDRENPQYNDLPKNSTIRYYAKQIEIIFPENYGAINVEGQEINSEIGPARYVRRLNVEGNKFIGYAETRVNYLEYTPQQALEWDAASDMLFDDKVYVSYAPPGSPALASLRNFNQAIEQASRLGEKGSSSQIRELLDPLIETDPNNVRLLIARGELLMKDDPALAERDLLRALLLESSNLRALEAAAQLYIDNEETLLARRMLDRILRRNEGHPWARAQSNSLQLNPNSQDTETRQ